MIEMTTSTTTSTKQIESAIRLAMAQTASGGFDTTVDLAKRLYGSRDAVHTQQEEIELIDADSKLLVANFSRF